MQGFMEMSTVNYIVRDLKVFLESLSERSMANDMTIFPAPEVDAFWLDRPLFQVLKDSPSVEQSSGIRRNLDSRADLATFSYVQLSEWSNLPLQALALVPKLARSVPFLLGQ